MAKGTAVSVAGWTGRSTGGWSRWALRSVTSFIAGRIALNLPDVVAPAVTLGNTEAIADVLFREYLLPFEIASILLLVAVVGSVVMRPRRGSDDASDN